MIASAAPSVGEPEGGVPPVSEEHVAKTLEVEVDASREQLEAILEKNRELAEQTHFLEQEVQRLRDALRDNRNSAPTSHTATELDNALALSMQSAKEGQPAVSNIEAAAQQAAIAATEPRSYSGVVFGGLVLLLGYWSVFGPYIRTRITFLGTGS